MTRRLSTKGYDPQRAVQDFHEKHGFTVGTQLPDAEHPHIAGLADSLMQLAGEALAACRRAPKNSDPRMERTALMAEELGELLEAMAQGDEVAAADAIGDLLYVVYGTAVTFNLPAAQLFKEVHDSNMTKVPTSDDGDTLLKEQSKKDEYRPPNIPMVLAAAAAAEVEE